MTWYAAKSFRPLRVHLRRIYEHVQPVYGICRTTFLRQYIFFFYFAARAQSVRYVRAGTREVIGISMRMQVNRR